MGLGDHFEGVRLRELVELLLVGFVEEGGVQAWEMQDVVDIGVFWGLEDKILGFLVLGKIWVFECFWGEKWLLEGVLDVNRASFWGFW